MWLSPLLIALSVGVIVFITYCVWRGWRDRSVDFICRAPVSPTTPDAEGAFYDLVLPTLTISGFRTVASGGNTTVMERSFFPAWTLILAVIIFPIGLLALLCRVRETVTIVTTVNSLEVHGRCMKPLPDYLSDAAEAVADGMPVHG